MMRHCSLDLLPLPYREIHFPDVFSRDEDSSLHDPTETTDSCVHAPRFPSPEQRPQKKILANWYPYHYTILRALFVIHYFLSPPFTLHMLLPIVPYLMIPSPFRGGGPSGALYTGSPPRCG